jgi:hypothetical protein
MPRSTPALETAAAGSRRSEGFWHGQREDVAVYVVSDEEHDRMRIMSPIGDLRVTDSGFLSILLQANFDRALDAKYALRKKELWSVFMHPLSTLVPDDLGIYNRSGRPPRQEHGHDVRLERSHLRHQRRRRSPWTSTTRAKTTRMRMPRRAKATRPWPKATRTRTTTRPTK